MKPKSFFKRVALVVSILLAISSNTNAQIPLTLEQQAAIEDTIKQLARVVEESAKQLDLDGSFNLFSDDPDFTFSEDGYIKPPKDSLYKIMIPVYANFSDIFMSYETMRITVLNECSGVFTGEGPWSATDLSGNKMGGHLVSMFVFVKRENKWKMIHGHTSHTFE